MCAERFDIAFSYSSQDKWIAKELFNSLTELGFSVYFSEALPDAPRGSLRKELMNIYNSSIINVSFWSKSYNDQPSDSFISFEKNILWERHVGRSEFDSLFILRLDETIPPNEFSQCTYQDIRAIGIDKAVQFIISRLVDRWTVTAEGKSYKHPNGSELLRGGMTPCKFVLSKNFYMDKLHRWKNLADVEVELIDRNLSGFLKVYLIPGSGAPKFLSHSLILKSNSECLKIKRDTTEAFVKSYNNKQLSGVLFDIKKEEMSLPHVYSLVYDEFLSLNWENFYKK